MEDLIKACVDLKNYYESINALHSNLIGKNRRILFWLQIRRSIGLRFNLYRHHNSIFYLDEWIN